MQMLVETTNNFMLINPATRKEIPWNRPAVVTSDEFVGEKIANKLLRILLPAVPDDVSDEDWVAWLKESKGDQPLAIESFASKFAKVGTSKK